ncbi:MAG: DUF1570 domain-containing protein [Planctomycetota bacterium]
MFISKKREFMAFVLCPLVLLISAKYCQAQSHPILRVDMRDGKSFLGMPIQWGAHEAILIQDTGAFQFLPVDQVSFHQVLEKNFAPQSLVATRANLQMELGNQFEAFISGPYVIASPRGSSGKWRTRFNALISGYYRYFKVRGWRLREVDFPLVVIVFPDRASFTAYSKTQQPSGLPQQAVGSYFPMTNRCILYHIPGRSSIDWSETESTIVHEAVHQLAYNTAIHERLFKNPFWFVEGLATMFEVRNVYELGLERSQLKDRVNRQQLETFRPLLKDVNSLERFISDLIRSDAPFKTNPKLAYAGSWALTFYLAERMPERYQTLMQLQSRRGLGDYSAAERQNDFARATGMSTSLLANQLVRFFQAIDAAL